MNSEDLAKAMAKKSTANQKKKAVRNKPVLAALGRPLLLLAIGLGTFWLGTQYGQLKPVSPKDQPKPEIPTPTAAPDFIADWKTYSSRFYQFKYPPDWQLMEEKSPPESGIILATNNIEYQDLGNVKRGALVYQPTSAVSQEFLDAILAENLKRGWKLRSKKEVKLGEVAAEKLVTQSPQGSAEAQFQFTTTTSELTFLSLVAPQEELPQRVAQFEQMLSTLELLRPGELKHFTHPKGLFEFDYPAGMSIDRSEEELERKQIKEIWQLSGEQATVYLTIEPFRAKSVEVVAKQHYQEIIDENRFAEPFSPIALAGQTAFRFAETMAGNQTRVSIYLTLSEKNQLLQLTFIKGDEGTLAEILRSLKIN